MGADLYIDSLFRPQHARWKALFEKAAQEQDQFRVGTAEWHRAQERVHTCFRQMYASGYFRDPYNPWDLLWQFGLSWADAVIPLLDVDSRLSPEGATKLLRMLFEREGVFTCRLALVSASDAKYFHDRYSELQAFLTQAITFGESIECSI